MVLDEPRYKFFEEQLTAGPGASVVFRAGSSKVVKLDTKVWARAFEKRALWISARFKAEMSWFREKHPKEFEISRNQLQKFGVRLDKIASDGDR